MTTLELYRKHKKGEIGRDRFLYEVRRDNNLPWITNITSYDDAVKILKNKGIIKEAQFEPQNIPTDPLVDRVNPYALKREVEKLLSKETELTNDSYKEALNKAAKKLTTPEAVKKAMFANAETVEKADAKLQMQPVKKANHLDKNNGMKKVKGQEMPKATAAPTGENKKTKKPKGVEIMKDKGVEGSEKVLREAALAELQSYLKKKLAENSTHYEFHPGMEVETAEGTCIVKEINGGTLTVETKDGKLMDVQMNHAKHFTEKKKEEGAIEHSPKVQEEASEMQDELEPGDRIKVTYGNKFYGMTGTIEDVKGGFVIVSIDDEDGEYSMHASDVEKIGEEEDNDEFYGEDDLAEAADNNSDFENGDKIKITSELSNYRGATGEIHDLHDDGTAMVILDNPKRTAITVDLSHVRKLRPDELGEAADVVSYTDAASGQKKVAGIYPSGKGSKEVMGLKTMGVTSAKVDQAK